MYLLLIKHDDHVSLVRFLFMTVAFSVSTLNDGSRLKIQTLHVREVRPAFKRRRTYLLLIKHNGRVFLVRFILRTTLNENSRLDIQVLHVREVPTFKRKTYLLLIKHNGHVSLVCFIFRIVAFSVPTL